MRLQIIVSVHAPVEIAKPHKIGLEYAVLLAGLCFWVLKSQIIQRKTTIRGIEVGHNKYIL